MNFLIKLLTLIFFVVQIYCDCNVCQGSNNVACHSENTFSLCIDDKPTEDYITCPENYVCTLDRLVCYPLPEATPSCIAEQIPDVNLCGVCSENKVYACLNETTIGFCMGNDAPIDGVVSYCPENTVCDIQGTQGYCSNDTLATPSCVSDSNGDGPGAEMPTTMEPATTTTSIIATTTTTIAESTTTTMEPTTTAAKTEPTTTYTTTSTTAEPITTTMEPTTPTTTTEPTTTATTTTTEPLTTTTTEPTSTITTEPITTSTTSTTTATATTTTTELITTPTTVTTTTEPIITTTTIEPTTTITTTAEPIFDATVFCKNLATTGSYPLDSDESCTSFVLCYTYGSDGVLYGLIKSCATGKYFNKESKICAAEKPEECI